MRNETRKLLKEYTARVAVLNNVETASENFNVEPSVQQTLERRVQQSSEFLRKINIEFVDEKEGEKIGVGVSGSIAGRTDTAKGDREPADVSDKSKNRYNCVQTNFDTSIRYSQLDAWRHKKNFQTILRDAINRQKALDRIVIGLNGTSVAATTDRVKYPLLQDVNKGWLQKYREESPERVMNEGTITPNKVVVGKDGDFANLDALVYDAVENLIDPAFADSADLVVLCGRGILHDKYFPIVNNADSNSERVAGKLLLANKSIGELPAYRISGFPKGAIMITPFDNLSIYIQNGTSRRQIVDNPKRDRIEDYQSSNEDYVVEQYGTGCVIENIEVK